MLYTMTYCGKKMSCTYNYYCAEGRNENRQKRFGPPPLHRRNSKRSVKKKQRSPIPEWNAAQYNNIINYVSLCAPPLHREDHERINDVALWAKSRWGRKLTYMHACGYIYMCVCIRILGSGLPTQLRYCCPRGEKGNPCTRIIWQYIYILLLYVYRVSISWVCVCIDWHLPTTRLERFKNVFEV